MLADFQAQTSNGWVDVGGNRKHATWGKRDTVFKKVAVSASRPMNCSMRLYFYAERFQLCNCTTLVFYLVFVMLYVSSWLYAYRCTISPLSICPSFTNCVFAPRILWKLLKYEGKPSASVSAPFYLWIKNMIRASFGLVQYIAAMPYPISSIGGGDCFDRCR